jgi:hypothetical protein
MPIKMDSSRTYLYRPLSSSEQIRIVILHPGFQDAPIECELRVVNLSENPAYQALFYTWGSHLKTAHIILNEKEVAVGANLWSTLWHLREYDRLHSSHKAGIPAKCLWIDAICIHQEGIAERNHQLGHMRQIYSRASEVVVWLGPAEGDSDLRMKLLNDCFSSTDSGLGLYASMNFPLHAKNAVINILVRKYWKRIWIIQEVLVARALYIYCGLQRAPWSQAFRDTSDVSQVPKF